MAEKPNADDMHPIIGRAVKMAGGKANGTDKTWTFTAFAIRNLLTILLSGGVAIVSASFTLGGMYFKNKDLPEKVGQLTVEVSNIHTEIKSIGTSMTTYMTNTDADVRELRSQLSTHLDKGNGGNRR